MIIARKQCPKGQGRAPNMFRQSDDAADRDGRMPDEDDTFEDINL